MILFRCDSSYEMGTGHVIRCLHLAQILKSLGHKVEFICKNLDGNISSKIKDQGVTVHLTDSDLDLIEKLRPQWVVVDNYKLDEKWEKEISKKTKIFVIDDLAESRHHCQVLLNQNFYTPLPTYKGLVPPACRLLIGPSYCLMKADLEKPMTAKKISSSPRVVAFFGGADESGELLKLAQALAEIETQVHFDLVALSSHKHLSALKALQIPENVSLHLDPKNWVELLKTSDFFVGSGGTVTWERLFLGLPGAVVAVAANQERSAQDLAKDGFQEYWGSASQVDYVSVIEQIDTLVFDKPLLLETMSERGMTLVHKFSEKLAQEIFGY